MIKCKEPTEHYSSGRALLKAWDTDKNGFISGAESARAIAQLPGEPPLTMEEINFIYTCYTEHGGSI